MISDLKSFLFTLIPCENALKHNFCLLDKVSSLDSYQVKGQLYKEYIDTLYHNITWFICPSSNDLRIHWPIS